MSPTIKHTRHYVGAPGKVCDTYRIEGGEVSEEWKPRGVPWCEFSIWSGNDGHVSAYGGEVWPLAWPELFEVRNASVYLTEAGKAAVDQATQ